METLDIPETCYTKLDPDKEKPHARREPPVNIPE